MILGARAQVRFWVAVIAGALLLVYLLGGVLTPFLIGMGIAYFLDPVVDRLERHKAPRWLATSVALILFLIVAVLLLLLLVPLLQRQIVELASRAPAYITALREWLEPIIAQVLERATPEDLARIRGQVSQYMGQVLAWAADSLGGVISGGFAVLNLLSVVFITPIVAWYLLRDWDKLTAKVDDLLPRDHAETLRRLAREVDETLAGFLRGQALVCFIQGAFYAIGLTIVGLEFGLIVGIFSGLITFIPYVGSIVGGLLSIGLALLQFSDAGSVIAVAVIYIFGQVMEGNILTPKLVGDKVGLHAVWVIFALLAGGALFGFAGVLIAVPVTAVIGVGVRHAIEQYRLSAYFLGDGRPDPSDPSDAPAAPEAPPTSGDDKP